MNTELIAPCGMNCGICKYHYRQKNPCPGCRTLQKNDSETRFHCIVRSCPVLQQNSWRFCSSACETYPCRRLRALDKRYTTKYHMSMLENLELISEQGVDALVQKESQKWSCPVCRGWVSCHTGQCLTCGFEKYTQ